MTLRMNRVPAPFRKTVTLVASVPASVIFVDDSFTDTNGTLIASHTGEVGATWTREYTFADVNWEVQGNTLQETDYAGSYADHYIHASGIPPQMDYYVEAELIMAGVTNNVQFALLARGYTVPDDGFGSPVEDGVEAFMLLGAAGNSDLQGRWSGGGGVVASTPSVADGSHIARLEVVGTTATLFYDGAQINTQTVTGITGLTPAGFVDTGYVAMAIRAAALNDIGEVKINYFRAGTL
jgi:hypothetical protein